MSVVVLVLDEGFEMVGVLFKVVGAFVLVIALIVDENVVVVVKIARLAARLAPAVNS